MTKALLTLVLVTLLIGAILPIACSSESSEKESEWYAGGTLHDATIAEWHKATYENRLATCADFVVTADKEEAKRDFSTLKPKAIEIERCITAATKGIPDVQNHKVAEYADLCLIGLGYKELGSR